jgi:hypothetical protein
MAVPHIEIRDALLAGINAKKTANGFTYNDFATDWSNQPVTDLAEFPAEGKVWIVVLASDDEQSESRIRNICKKYVPVQVAIQRQCDQGDKTLQDTMVTLEDQIREYLRTEFTLAGWQWCKCEALKDDNGTPYSYMGLREVGIWETYFTATFLFIRS